jgi:hypothetical protein
VERAFVVDTKVEAAEEVAWWGDEEQFHGDQ